MEFLEREEFLSFLLSGEEVPQEKAKSLFIKTKTSENTMKYAKEIRDKNPSKIKEIEHFLPNGKRHGESFAFYSYGTKAGQCTFIDGKAEGKYISFFQSGKIHEEIEFQSGILHGERKVYFSSGELYCSETWVKGKIFEIGCCESDGLYKNRIITNKNGMYRRMTFFAKEMNKIVESTMFSLKTNGEPKKVLFSIEYSLDKHIPIFIVRETFHENGQLCRHTESDKARVLFSVGFDDRGNVVI